MTHGERLETFHSVPARALAAAQRPARGTRVRSRWARFALRSTLISALLGCAACVSVPSVEPVQFAVDDDQLRDAASERELEAAAEALAEDPDLHLLVIGHADEDNTDEYNRELSLRRAEHVRERLLELGEPSFAARIEVEARGEWDASAAGDDDAAKARNRRVELRFHYPRQCEPSFDSSFLACEWARLPEPEPEPAPEPEPEPEHRPPLDEPAPAPVPPRLRQDYVGPYVYGIVGYGMASSEFLRQSARWGVGGGYLFGVGQEFRVAVGLDFDHLIDAGFVFPQPDSCAPFCSEIDRSRLRVVPNLRFGGVRGGLWGWVRLSAGLVVQRREALLSGTVDDPVIDEEGFWAPGVNVGIGPGVAITLTEHLLFLLEGSVSYGIVPRIYEGSFGGAVIFDVGTGLGWMF